MTRTEHLLWILAEECSEVAQRASKAARFGLGESQPGQEWNNAHRLVQEYADLAGVLTMLQEEGALPPIPHAHLQAKREKVEKYLLYSAECGTLDAPATDDAPGGDPWASCAGHDWRRDHDGAVGDEVTCTKCGCPGSIDDANGEVFWPAT